MEVRTDIQACPDSTCVPMHVCANAHVRTGFKNMYAPWELEPAALH